MHAHTHTATPRVLIGRRGIKSLRFYVRKPSKRSLLHVEALPSSSSPPPHLPLPSIPPFLLPSLPPLKGLLANASPASAAAAAAKRIQAQGPSFITQAECEAAHASAATRDPPAFPGGSQVLIRTATRKPAIKEFPEVGDKTGSASLTKKKKERGSCTRLEVLMRFWV